MGGVRSGGGVTARRLLPLLGEVRFLALLVGTSAFLNGGRRVCLVAQRVPALVRLVRWCGRVLGWQPPGR